MHLITPVLPGLLFYLRNNKGMSNNRIGEDRRGNDRRKKEQRDSDRRVIPTFTDIKEKRKKEIGRASCRERV